jgi:hypothetical protein
MSPSHATKRGRRWRYYVSQAVLQGRKHEAGSVARAPALEIEARVAEAARAASPASNRQGRHELHHPNASNRGASTDSPAVHPSDYDATLRAAIERVVISRCLVRKQEFPHRSLFSRNRRGKARSFTIFRPCLPENLH